TLLLRGHFEFVERLPEILDERVELGALDAHAMMHRLHVAARVLARPARRLADLIDELVAQIFEIAQRKPRLDARVAGDVDEEIVDDGLDGTFAAEAIEQRLLRRATARLGGPGRA